MPATESSRPSPDSLACSFWGCPNSASAQAAAPPAINQADTAWMLVATALVLLMTPALAFFYGGLVRSKNALNTMMMSFVSLGFVGVLWAVIGYSLAFGTGGTWIGDLSKVFLRGVGLEPQGTIPHVAVHGLPGHLRDHHGGADFGRDRGTHALLGLRHVHFALGAGRLQPGGALGLGRGWLAKWGALDFAGGTVVHVNAAIAALVAAILSGQAAGLSVRRRSFRITFRSRCWAPDSSGSAGSVSTPEARSRRARLRHLRS